ncbi:MAG: type I 3-dehydroquinate dehydratase [Thermoprotei archaeon]|nr:MAG: type I 3-dehydroquinate dehydratase [Thermoprotei archaeon]
MNGIKVCAVITRKDEETIELANEADLVELRIDLIGSRWKEIVDDIRRPWIACNRRRQEGGSWRGDEESRLKELLEATELGADFIDIELFSPNLNDFINRVKEKCGLLISFHDFRKTPPLDRLRKIVRLQKSYGADVCKVVTKANKFEDNIRLLKLVREFSKKCRIVGFCMGDIGIVSRILSPLVGGCFVYVSVLGQKSAEGQLDLRTMKEIIRVIEQADVPYMEKLPFHRKLSETRGGF